MERAKSTWESFNGSTKQINIMQQTSIIDRDKTSNLMVYCILSNYFKKPHQTLTNLFCKDHQSRLIKKSHPLSQHN